MPPPLRKGPSAYTQGSRPLQPGETGFCYLRVSTDEQATSGYGLDVQREQCEQLWTRDGVQVREEHIFADDWTGTRLDRPALQCMLALMGVIAPFPNLTVLDIGTRKGFSLTV
jgi:Resolvase, N terminal domain